MYMKIFKLLLYLVCPSTTAGFLVLRTTRRYSYRTQPGGGSSSSLLNASDLESIQSLWDVHELAETKPIEYFFPFLSRLVGTPTQARHILSFVRADINDIRQFILFAFIGYVLPEIGRRVGSKVDYNETRVFHVINHISQGFKIGAFITFIESTAQFFMGFEDTSVVIVTKAISTICFGLWGMYRIKFLKNIAVSYGCRRLKIYSVRLIRFYERLTDYVVYLITNVVLLDTLGFNYKQAISAISVFGGFGTILLSLSSRDIASQLLSGLSISLSEPFHVGDKVQLEDGKIGVVEYAGPLHTLLRGEDEILLKIPNLVLQNSSFSNLSLGTTSQVKQDVHIDYSGSDKVINLVEKLKHDIIASCPKVISDGSKPFRVHWTSLGKQSATISVSLVLDVPPCSEEYYDLQQVVLTTIANAAGTCKTQ